MLGLHNVRVKSLLYNFISNYPFLSDIIITCLRRLGFFYDDPWAIRSIDTLHIYFVTRIIGYLLKRNHSKYLGVSHSKYLVSKYKLKDRIQHELVFKKIFTAHIYSTLEDNSPLLSSDRQIC